MKVKITQIPTILSLSLVTCNSSISSHNTTKSWTHTK